LNEGAVSLRWRRNRNLLCAASILEAVGKAVN